MLHDEVLAADAGNVPIVLRLTKGNNLVGLPGLRLQQRDGHLADPLIRLRVVNVDLVDVRDQEGVHRRQVEAHGPFKDVVTNGHLVVVDVAPSVHIKGLLVGLVRDAVLDSRAEHHLVAAHEVEHHVFELGLESLQIDQVEVDVVVRRDLDSNVTLDVKDEASDVEGVILHPFLVLWIVFVRHDLEEQHCAGATSDQRLVVEQVHLAEIFVGHLLDFEVRWVACFNRESLSLSVEAIDNVIFGIVKTFVWEVHSIAVHLVLMEAAFVNGVLAVVVDEVVVHLVVVVKQLHRNTIVGNEAASDEWIWEARDRHRVVIEAEGGVDVEIFVLTLLLRPLHFVEDAETELAIVDEDDRVLVARRVLLDLLRPDIALFATADTFFESLLVRLEIVHADPEFAVISL